MSRPSKYKLAIAFLLFAVESCVAAWLTFFVETDAKNSFYLGRSVERWGLSMLLAGLTVASIGTAITIYRNEKLSSKITALLASRNWQVGIVLGLLLSAFLLNLGYFSKTFIVRLAPAGICVWLIGLELLFFAPAANTSPADLKSETPASKRAWILAIVCILGIYLAALLPSQIPALMDGAPWNTPLEFILLTLLLPLAILVNWRTFSRRWMLILTALALAVKLFLDLFAPASGISILAYTSQANMQQGNWMRGYESVLDGSASARMRQPYDNYRQFPLEWVNNQYYDVKNTWLGLKLSAYARLEPGERLVFVANGFTQGEIDFIDTRTGQKYQTLLMKGDQPVDPEIYSSAPATRTFQLQGELVYKGDSNYRLIPLLVSSNGAISDPLAQGKIWRFQSTLKLSQGQLNFFRFLSSLADGLLILVIVAGLIWGVWDLFCRSLIGSLDLYLAASAALVYLFFNLQPNMNMNSYIEGFILGAVMIKALETILKKKQHANPGDFSIAILPILLVSLLSLNILTLRQITIFPGGQDGLEYQTLGRDIFVNADYLMLNDPPRAYKVLFPFVVGSLHVLFGQSSASLFFLCAWCAGLTAKYCLEILSLLKIPRSYGDAAVLILLFLWLGPLFNIYYFSFGLIEPLSTLCLILLFYFALRRKLWQTFIAGALVVLFRLDYLGAALAGIFLTGDMLQGTFRMVWRSLLQFIVNKWKMLLAYASSLLALPVIITLFYYFIQPGYQLSASDTRYTSVADMLQGLFKILNGGSQSDIQSWLIHFPLDINLLLIVLYLGTLLGLLSLLARFKTLERIDARVGIVLAGFYLTYMLARPTGYPPRFSTPLVPLALIIIMVAIHQVFSAKAICPTE